MVKNERRSARSNSDKANSGSRSRWLRYGPLVLWAALIFFGSGNLLSGSNTSGLLLGWLRWLLPHAGDQTLDLIHRLIRKAGHLTEYAILAWLAARAFRSSSRELLRQKWFGAALILVAAYSLSDEFHQSFVPSRGASIRDCLIDTAGGLLALLWLAWRARRNTKELATD